MCFIYSTILCISYVPSAGKAAVGHIDQPTPVFLPGKFHGQRKRRRAGYSLWGRKSQTRLSAFHFTAHHGTSSVSENKSPLTFRVREKSASCSRRRTESSGSYMFHQSFLFYKKLVSYHLTAAFAVMIEACSGRL